MLLKKQDVKYFVTSSEFYRIPVNLVNNLSVRQIFKSFYQTHRIFSLKIRNIKVAI